MNRLLLRLLCAVTTLLPAAAFAQQDLPSEKVVLWTSYRGEERSALQALVDRHNRSAGPVEIELLAVPSKAYKTRLQSAIPRGNGPDLFIEAHELTGQ